MKIWSKRWSCAWGTHWCPERDVTEETKDAWLEIFQKDEPGVEFRIAEKQPKVTKEDLRISE